ncbi:MAG TPA: hypothetical protein VK772_12860 [Puia sp.]|jgi:hypothetical protein|nr:hypothetical protein [Puia sp.]
MRILNFEMYQDCVSLFLPNGETLIIYFTEDTGKIIYRDKIRTISRVKHPGICLGNDVNDERFFIHNHYEVGSASVVDESSFTKGMVIVESNEICSNDPIQRIHIALDQVIHGKRYHVLNNNCQTLKNKACNNLNFSEDISKWTGGILLSTIAVVGIGLLLTQNKGGKRGKKW